MDELSLIRKSFNVNPEIEGFYTKTDPKLRPYEFYQQYIKQLRENYPYEKLAKQQADHIELWLNKSRIIELDKRLIPVFESTDNTYQYRPLFFDKIFLNCDFQVKGFLIKGIMLAGGYVDFLKRDDWILEAAVRDTETKNSFLIQTFLTRELEDEVIDYGSELLNKMVKESSKYLRNIAANIVDFVENEDKDIEIRTVEPSREQQAKREARQKKKLPVKVYIRPRDTILKYLTKFNEDAEKFKRGVSGIFPVRGTWRTYRHERYSEKRKQKKQWINPFFKGSGEEIASIYKVMARRQSIKK